MNDFLAFLEKTASDPALETEWVDLLAQLEYVGCRKILKGVDFERVNLSVLQHVMEEASHAYLMKRAAGPEVANRPWTEGKFAQAGWKYFQTLDTLVSAELPEAHCYPVVSWIVERRVMEVYPAYLKVTRNEAVREALTTIIEQERRHGKLFDAFPIEADRKGHILSLERELWKQLLTSFSA